MRWKYQVEYLAAKEKKRWKTKVCKEEEAKRNARAGERERGKGVGNKVT